MMRARIKTRCSRLLAVAGLLLLPWPGAAQTVEAPEGLYVAAVSGNTVTLRWDRPSSGPEPDGYVVEGGLAPGAVAASLPTGLATPIYTFAAPTGSFFVRVHSLLGGARSGPSNEVPLHVDVPVLPNPPANLTGLVNGSSIALSWWNNYTGGPPASLLLDVTGALTTTLPLPLAETFTFAGVPPGSYTLRLRAANAGGMSVASNPVTLTFPGACSGPPLRPEAFVAYAVGRTVFCVWGPAVSGPATTSFLVNVGGSYTGSIPTPARTISGSVAPGSYDLSIVALNACGASPPSTVRTVSVP